RVQFGVRKRLERGGALRLQPRRGEACLALPPARGRRTSLQPRRGEACLALPPARGGVLRLQPRRGEACLALPPARGRRVPRAVLKWPRRRRASSIRPRRSRCTWTIQLSV